MNSLKFMLGTGLLKKEKKPKELMKTKSQKEVRRSKAVEIFLREILGTHLIQIEKKY